jgi:hypothetical protein
MSESLQKKVYLGRGPGCYRQPGNKEYRGLIKLYAADFHRDASRVHKTKFVDNLQSKLEVQGFEFFSYSEEQQKWVNALYWEIKEKIGHDLRDNRKSLSNAKSKKRVSKATRKNHGTFSKPLTSENERNHAALSASIQNNEFKVNGKMDGQNRFQVGFMQGYIREANRLHYHHNHNNYAMLPTAGLQMFPKCVLNDCTRSGFYMGEKDVNTLTRSTGEGNHVEFTKQMNVSYTSEANRNNTEIAENSCYESLPYPSLRKDANDVSDGKNIFILNGINNF